MSNSQLKLDCHAERKQRSWWADRVLLLLCAFAALVLVGAAYLGGVGLWTHVVIGMLLIGITTRFRGDCRI